MSRFALRSGSSPRVRGAVIRLSAELRPHGIIPARAGSRGRACETTTWRRDHPRACGEQGQSQPSVNRSEGSSPRVRGAVFGGLSNLNGRGIIPARAGSRPSPCGRSGRSRDHPRACGEQQRLVFLALHVKGSSPRVRGAVSIFPAWRTRDGIIPARAGSSCPRGRSRASRRDHPRACGEQRSNREEKQAFAGSSPRVRGAGRTKFLTRRQTGIIPARAGSSWCRTSR